jgi:HPt (histidine-containing phosphotransfer) domain-containing protein
MSSNAHSGTSPHTDGPSLLDRDTLDGLKELGGDDDPELFFELIDLFLADAPQRIEEIRRGLEQADIKLLERAAHTLKSSSANVGALSLSQLCRRMEEQARTGQTVELPELYDESNRLWPRVRAALEAERAGRGEQTP